MVLRVACHGGHVVCLVTPSRVWVVVNPRVTSQLVRPAEAFCATWKRASVWLLSRVCSYVPCLVFQSVEALIAQRALVRSR